MASEDIKVILLGDANVGKTSIFMRFFESTWNRQIYQNTIGMVFRKTEMTSKGKKLTIGVWDTAGSERYEAITKLHYRNANYAILCFDPSCVKTWERVKFWYNELQLNTEDCKICICATKKDLIDSGELKYQVDLSDVQNYTNNIHGFYLHVSSKHNENIDNLFQRIVDNCANDTQFLENLNRRLAEKEANQRCAITREKIASDNDKCC